MSADRTDKHKYLKCNSAKSPGACSDQCSSQGRTKWSTGELAAAAGPVETTPRAGVDPPNRKGQVEV